MASDRAVMPDLPATAWRARAARHGRLWRRWLSWKWTGGGALGRSPPGTSPRPGAGCRACGGDRVPRPGDAGPVASGVDHMGHGLRRQAPQRGGRAHEHSPAVGAGTLAVQVTDHRLADVCGQRQPVVAPPLAGTTTSPARQSKSSRRRATISPAAETEADQQDKDGVVATATCRPPVATPKQAPGLTRGKRLWQRVVVCRMQPSAPPAPAAAS